MDKQIIFKSNKLSRTTVKNNITKVYLMSKDTSNWYAEALEFCTNVAKDNNQSIGSVVGVVSALSPRKNWIMNKKIAVELIKTNDCGHMKVFVQKARDCLTSNTDKQILKVLNGKKISSFYLNIRYPDRIGTVTIDRHAIAVAIGRTATNEELALTDKQYKFFEDTYKYTAKMLGVTPQLLQAITWETWRVNKSKTLS
jgi:hypothetical protein